MAAANNNAELRYGGNNGLNSPQFGSSSVRNSVVSVNDGSSTFSTPAISAVSGSSSSGNTAGPPAISTHKTSTQIADLSSTELPGIEEEDTPVSYLKRFAFLSLAEIWLGLLQKLTMISTAKF